jgi:uncharacterized protein YjdB
LAAACVLGACGDDDDGGRGDAGLDAGDDAGAERAGNPAVELSIAPASFELALGTSTLLRATVRLRQGQLADVSALVIWSSDDDTIAVADNSGRVRGASAGSTRIRAELKGLHASARVTVRAVELSSIAIEPASARLALGTGVRLHATGRFSDGSTQPISDDVQWSSDAERVASVDARGAVQALALGSATIAAELSGVRATCAITVTGAQVTSIDLTPASATVEQGGTIPLVATAVFDDDSTQDITRSASWTSSDDAVAEVDADGVVSGVGQGSAAISAAFGGQLASATIEVSGEALVAIAIAPALPEPLPIGASQQFQLTGTLAGGGSVDLTYNTNVSFESSNPGACAISNQDGSKGVASGVALGETMISASFVGFGHVLNAEPIALSCTDARLVSLVIEPDSSTIPAGVELPFTAVGTYSDGSIHDETESSDWSVGDGDVATVGAAAGRQGIVHALLAGDTAVTASQEIAGTTISAQAVLHVDLGVLSVLQVSGTHQVAKGATTPFHATGLFSDGYSYDLTSVVAWSLSDPHGTPARASISNASGSEGVLTALDFTDASDRLDDITVIASWAGGGVRGSSKLSILTDVISEVQVVVGSRASTPGLPFLPDLCYSDGCPGTSVQGGPIPVGETARAYAVCRFEDERFELCDQRVTFVSGTTSVIDVSNELGEKGLVSALGPGSSTIGVMPIDGALIHSATVGTSDCPVQALTVETFDPAEPTFNAVPAGPDALEIPPGTSRQLRVRAQLDLAANGCSSGPSAGGGGYDATEAATWSSSDGEVADMSSLDERGLVRAEKMPASPFTADITAAFGGQSDSGRVHVGAACLIGLQVTPSDVDLPYVLDYDPRPASVRSQGVSAQLSALGTFSDGSTVDVSDDVAWAVLGGGDVLEVDEHGRATTLGLGAVQLQAGSAAIATCDDQALSATVDVAVSARRLAGLTLSPEQPLLARGSSLQLTATGTFDDDSVYDLSHDASWTSSNTSVAIVAGTGLALAADVEGAAIVSAAIAGITASVPLTVQGRHVTGVTLSIEDDGCSSAGLYPLGAEIPLHVLAHYEDGGDADVTLSAQLTSTVKAAVTFSGGRALTVLAGATQLSATLDGVSSPPVAIDVRGATLDSITVREAASGLDTGWTIPQGLSAPFVALAQYTLASPPATVIPACDVTRRVTWDASPSARIGIDPDTGVALATNEVGSVSVSATIGQVSDLSTGSVAGACLQALEAMPGSAMLLEGDAQDVHVRGVYSDGSTNDSLPIGIDIAHAGVFDVTAGTNPGDFAIASGVGAPGEGTAVFVLESSAVPGVMCPGLDLISVQLPVVVTPAELSDIGVLCYGMAAFGGSTTGDTMAPNVRSSCIATGELSDGTSVDVTKVATWSSTVPAVADVGGDGTLHSFIPGSTSISAQIGDITGSVPVTVNDATLQGITVSSLVSSRPVGFQVPFVAIGQYSVAGGGLVAQYGVTADATWTTSAPTVASVGDGPGDKGVVTTLLPSGGPIQVIASYQGHMAQADFTVNAGTPASIAIANAGDVHQGLHLQLNAIVTYDDVDASTRDVSSEATWGSSDANVFAAPAAGLLTGKNPGSAFATVQLGALDSQASVTVLPACVQSIALTSSALTVPRDVPVDFSAVATMSDGSHAPIDDSAGWSSSDPTRMAAPQGGYAFSSSDAAPGKVEIGASPGVSLAKCPDADLAAVTPRVTITITGASLSAIDLAPGDASVPAGQQLQLTATGAYSDGSHHDITRRCAFTSADPFIASVAGGLDDPEAGSCSANHTGATTVSASQGLRSGAANVHVTGATLENITVLGMKLATGLASDPPAACRDRGSSSSYALGPATVPDDGFITYARAIGTFSDGEELDVTDQVTWSSSDDTIASVSDQIGDKGRITSVYRSSNAVLQNAMTVIRASQGAVSGTMPLIVRDAFLNALVIDREHDSEPDPMTLAVGSERTLQLHGRFGATEGVLADGDEFFCIGEAASWSADLGGYVQVSSAPGQRGALSGERVGSAVVTATVGALSDAIDVDVTEAGVTSLTLAPAEIALASGDSAQLQVLATLSDGSIVDLSHPLDGSTSWSVADDGVAEVSASGVVSAVAPGSTTVQACSTRGVNDTQACALDSARIDVR